MPGKDKSALICGSVAYDTIMVFPDRFRAHILPDKLHMLNVAFLVPQMRREFGGCAGNIAYNLKLLGETGYPMGGIGRDFQPYREWMQKSRHVREVPRDHSGRALRAGVHHHGPRFQPDHRVPSGRHESFAPHQGAGE